MVTRIISILKKIKTRGVKWFFDRLVQEVYIPETSIGKKIKTINILLHKVFSFPGRIMNNSLLISDTLFLFYDLEVSPITFDLCWVLCLGELQRRKLNLDHLHVVFVPGSQEGVRKETEQYESIIDTTARHWRKYNLLYPLTHLLPSCSSFTVCRTRAEAAWIEKKMVQYRYPQNYYTKFPIASSPQEISQSTSNKIMALRATPQALRYIQQWLDARSLNRKVITITLRQYGYMPQRNSNIQAWTDFLKTLDPNLYFVVILPDTEIIMRGVHPLLKEFTHFTEGCWNLELRMALYESSYLNLGINNGPFALCWLNKKCRYIMFKIITEEVPETTTKTFEKLGFSPGKSPPFLTEHQKWIWEPDERAVIEREFHALCAILDKENKLK